MARAMLVAPARFVEGARVVAPAPGRACHERLPDGRTTIVLRVLESGGGGRGGDVAVAGPRTRALFKSTSGVARAVIVQLKPGWAAPLLGVAASALTDRVVLLEDLWGGAGAELRDELLAARGLPEMVSRLSQALLARAGESFESSSARLARRAVALLEADAVRVDKVAEQLGVTARHLRRAFTESIGVAPKDFARAVRLQRALRLAEASQDWARIATAAGYYDQSHLIADFRELVGLTPGAYAKRGDELRSAS